MHFLVTGHTGFKGAWLTMLLLHRGHTVSGIALDPEPGSLFEQCHLEALLAADHRIDIRDTTATRASIVDSGADVVMHMAAQPLVRESYRNPRYTYETNVMGTLSVLEAIEQASTVRAALIVTTDKVYRNDGRTQGYTEHDALGGADPYSTSKAMADLLTQAWSRTAGVPTAIARAGNVIGGGDVCNERLIPDLVAAAQQGVAAELRHPEATRPWQHVLDCLDGYLTIVDALLTGRGTGAWNVGPDPRDSRTVGEVASAFCSQLGAPTWTQGTSDGLHEASALTLDSARLRQELGWVPRLDVEQAIRWTASWHRAVAAGSQPRAECMQQVTAHSHPTTGTAT